MVYGHRRKYNEAHCRTHGGWAFHVVYHGTPCVPSHLFVVEKEGAEFLTSFSSVILSKQGLSKNKFLVTFMEIISKGVIMLKKLIILFFLFSICFISLANISANENHLELAVKKIERISKEELMIQYGVINRRNFDCFNVSIAFKILEGDVPVSCKEIKETIPKGADGTDLNEVKIKVPADAKDLNIESAIFFSTKRYRIENWFSGCKEF